MTSYEEGQKAYRNGQGLSDNPYDECSDNPMLDDDMLFDFTEWREGWMDAERGVDREEIDENH